MMEKYGSEFYVNCEHFKKQMMEKYGCEFPLQNDKLFSKMLASSFRRRIYKYGDGSSTMIQGYEDLALKELEDSKLYSKIEAGDSPNIPTFWYEFNGKKHKYYPDIYIPLNNTIIEVKSTYYFEKDKEKNLAKAIEVSKTYKFFFYVYFDRKKSKTLYSLNENNDLIVIEEVQL